MRTALLLGAVVLPAALLATGCSSDVQTVGGSAGPVTASPSAVATTTTTSTAVVPATSVSSAPDRTVDVTVPASRPASMTLGPTGLGKLKLGMTQAQANATGQINVWGPVYDGQTATKGCIAKTTLKLAEKGRGVVYFSTGLGVVIIDGFGGMASPQGIGVGSPTSEVLKAYPDYSNVDEGQTEGRGYAAVPGNSGATYRIEIKDGRVSHFTLQSTKQDCYE
ncbi:hypothetical protein [Paractinoplanes durhamensis]|uniref:Uncharacterized protein n=1 Tax=Paractinoplanes durhamensis TaxID=113563 RepID=A0ABQ3Z4B2_9ACTN|nr:hypothetical protein [Actinoplanes durhamensis]GIE04673.1 hypothetical protein Adu01nite_60230 [Actinoplanes durhamensis]